MDPGTALMLVSSGVKAVGSIAGAQSQAKGMKAEASIADANARATGQQYAQREDQVRREARQKMGAMAAGIAESGTGFTGSNLDLLRQDGALAELDALNTRYEGSVKATSYRNQATGLRKQASATLTAGWIGAATEALGAGANYFGGMKPKKGA